MRGQRGLAECAIRCMECHALLRDCTTGELTWPGGVSRSPPSPDMCKALTSPPLPHRHGGRPRRSRPASPLTAPASSSAAFARLPALLTGRAWKPTASGRLRRTGRPRYRHPLSLALSLNPPILLLSRLPFTQGAPGQGRQRLRGHGWCDLPGSGRRAGKGRRRREGGRRSQLNLDTNHNLRSKQGSKTVFPHPYTFDI